MRHFNLVYHKYYDSIKMGLLVGVLIGMVYVVMQQAKILNRIYEVARQNEQSNQLTIDYVQCIALIHPDFRTKDNIQTCVKEGNVPSQVRATQSKPEPTTAKTVVPPTPQATQPRETPTTSEPPEKNPVQRLGERLTDVSNVLESIVKGLLGDTQ